MSAPLQHAAVSCWRDRSWWLTMMGVGVALSMLVLGSLALLSSRQDTWHAARQNANNLLLALDRDVSRNLAVLDLSLQGVIEALGEPGIDGVSPLIRHHALFDRSATAEDLGSILVLDTEGNVIDDSTSLTPHELHLSDRDYFKVHVQRSDAGLFVSRTFNSRLGGGDPRFAISRRYNTVNDEFGGVVSATLRLNYLHRLFEKLDIGAKGAISLIRTDGRVLYRYPFRKQDLDVLLPQRGLEPGALLTKNSGQYVATASLDNVERLYTFRRVGDLPLVLTVSLSTEEILAPWWRKAMVIGTILVLLCGLAVTSSVLFRREMLRRAVSERALAEAAAQLSVLASTDGLTGVMNRRTLDTEFARAFRTAIRNGTSLATLMIDADFFKRYNDTYGHIAGDEVLRRIVSCIVAHVRRPDDLIARFGGEEFCVVLPDTTLAGALAIGERIRVAVLAEEVEHASSPIEAVSVSIGVAVMTPLIGDTPENLLTAADQSLYDAKLAGRNRVRSTIEPEHTIGNLSEIAHVALAYRAAASDPRRS